MVMLLDSLSSSRLEIYPPSGTNYTYSAVENGDFMFQLVVFGTLSGPRGFRFRYKLCCDGKSVLTKK